VKVEPPRLGNKGWLAEKNSEKRNFCNQTGENAGIHSEKGKSESGRSSCVLEIKLGRTTEEKKN